MRAEKIVLGTAIAEPSTVEEILKLRISDFTGLHRDMYTIIRDLADDNSLSLGAVVERLRDDGLLMLIGDEEHEGVGYIQHLVSLADSQGIRSFVKKIEDEAVRRNVLEMAALLATEVRNSDKNIQEIMDEAEKRIFNLRRRTTEDEGLSFGEIMSSYIPYLDGLREGTIRPAWVPPLAAVRELVQYVHRTDFVIIAGRPGDGKSSLLRYDALKTALGTEDTPPMPVVTFNLENDPHEYMKFGISALANINSARLKNPESLTETEFAQVRSAAETLSSIPWNIITLSRPTAMQIDRIARKQVAEGSKIIQVDYLQLISNNSRSRVEDLADTTGILRGVALKTNVPVIAACQLSRAIEVRGDMSEPRLSDLRESGSIEQDATQVWFIRSLWNRPPDSDEITDPRFRFAENFHNGHMIRDVIQAIPVRIWVKKNRNGPIGFSKPIKWTMSTGRFESLRGD